MPKETKKQTIVKETASSKELVVSQNALVTIIGSGNSIYLKENKEYHVHVILAKTLVKNGSAIYKQ